MHALTARVTEETHASTSTRAVTRGRSSVEFSQTLADLQPAPHCCCYSIISGTMPAGVVPFQSLAVATSLSCDEEVNNVDRLLNTAPSLKLFQGSGSRARV